MLKFALRLLLNALHNSAEGYINCRLRDNPLFKRRLDVSMSAYIVLELH